MIKQFTDRISPSIKRPLVDLPFEANTDSYHAWEASLPILNLQATATMLSTAAQGLSSSTISSSDQLNLAEAAQPCLVKLLSHSIEKVENAKLPLQKELSDISTATLNALDHFHSIYMVILCSPDFLNIEPTDDETEIPLFTKQQKALLIFRALELLNMSQLFMSLIYKQPTTVFWNSANALIELAESLSVQQIGHVTNNEQHTSTIENEFKKIHFLHLARSNRFRQSDIKTIQRILSQQANDILISTEKNESCEFCIDLSSSKPISHISEVSNTNERFRYLSNEQLVQFMLSNDVIAPERHGAISLVAGKPILSKKTIRQLLPSWSTTQSRQAPRHSQTEKVSVYPGFDSIIKALIIKQNPNHYDKKAPQPNKDTAAFSLNDLELLPMGEHQHNHHDRSATSANKMLKASIENEFSSNTIWHKKRNIKPGEKGEEMKAELNDASLQGFMFNVSAKNKPLLKATDLIGVQSKSESLQLAIIRRINSLDNGDVSVGVEMMSPNLKIATIKFHDKEVTPKLVIFLQGIPAINQDDAILSPLFLENIHEDIVLKSNNEKTYYSIDKTIETNQVFTHYTVLKQTSLD